MNRRIKVVIVILLTAASLMLLPEQKVIAEEQKENIVVVIDPGHGGSQKGAEYNGLEEKDINMLVASVMAEELEKYDDVEVYLTHTSAEDEMSIKERMEFADEVDADYFFCIHFNASGNHNFYGAETWITSYGRYYAEMHTFSEILLKEFEGIGVFNRGIKTKLETDGTDYYGVLRRGAEFDIPAVIIEHCHMDNEEDTQFLNEDALIRFGKLDASAAAKFLGLKSSETGEDYTDFEVVIASEPEGKKKNDETPPECKVSIALLDDDNQTAVFRIEATDEEYPILYYGYSFDKGETFTPLYRWDRNQEYMEFVLNYSECVAEDITVVVYNAFNIGETSSVSLKKVQEQMLILEEKKKEEAARQEETAVIIQKQTGGEVYLVIAVLCVLGIIVTIIGTITDIKRTSGRTKSNDEV